MSALDSNPLSARLLVDNLDANSLARQTLRSGLYFLRDPVSQCVVYAIYWPEDTTWDDDAVSSVQRNRIAFMRSVPHTISNAEVAQTRGD